MTAKKKTYQKTKTGKRYYDNKGYNRYSTDGGKTVYGSNYKLGVGKKKFK